MMCFIPFSSAFAAYVSMAEFDINGDGQDEIVRAEGTGEGTSIKIYEKIENSYFFKPAEDIAVPGNLVQAPDIKDVTGDNILDFFFATGSDLGIIYYDTVEGEYRRQYEVNGNIEAPYMADPVIMMEKQVKARAESDILLQLQGEAWQNDREEDEIPVKDASALQTI